MKSSNFLAPISILTICFVFSAQAAADGNAQKGAEVFEDVCSMCCGEQAEGGEDFEAPKLAGQYDWYLKIQLSNFRKGIRGTHKDDDNGHVMRPMAMVLSDTDVDDVIAHIMTLDANFVKED
jgi:cytochrome c oxidase subunit 2